MRTTSAVMMAAAVMMTATPARAGKGSLDKDTIRTVVRAHISEIRQCYNEGLQRKPELAGKFNIDFEIAENGEVTASKVSGSTLNDTTVEACMAATAKSWKFPAPTGGSVAVTYPFVVEPG